MILCGNITDSLRASLHDPGLVSNAYRRLTEEGLPVAVIQSGLETNPVRIILAVCCVFMKTQYYPYIREYGETKKKANITKRYRLTHRGRFNTRVF